MLQYKGYPSEKFVYTKLPNMAAFRVLELLPGQGDDSNDPVQDRHCGLE